MDRYASRLQYPEGPVVGPAGELYVVELGGAAVRSIAPGGEHAVLADLGGAPNGATRTAGGDLLVCNNGGRHPPAPSTEGRAGAGGSTAAIQVVRPDGSFRTLLDAIDGEPLTAPNDICLDGTGGFWFSDPSWEFLDDGMAGPGTICYGTLDGGGTRVHRGLRFPNGVALDPSGGTLYVTESSTGVVWAFDVLGPAQLGSARRFAACGPGALPDGMAVDERGFLLVAGHGSGVLHVFDPDGQERDRVAAPADAGLSNLCFGGPAETTLFVTAAAIGEVLTTEWPVAGLALRT